jgi:hypothetical protein
MDQEFESLSKQNMSKMKSNKKKFEDEVSSGTNISKTKPQVDNKSSGKYQVISESKPSKDTKIVSDTVITPRAPVILGTFSVTFLMNYQ